jgi:hypothetical protein
MRGKASVRAEFCLIPAEFDDFLFAAIGEEKNGIELTVISAFTRLGVDPWNESARLSDLPKRRAAQVLSPLLAQLPGGNWEPWEVPAIATRLVALLPARRSAPGPTRSAVTGRREGNSWAAVWLMVLVLAAAAMLAVLGGFG